jgi:hypothetical protein
LFLFKVKFNFNFIREAAMFDFAMTDEQIKLRDEAREFTKGCQGK